MKKVQKQTRKEAPKNGKANKTEEKANDLFVKLNGLETKSDYNDSGSDTFEAEVRDDELENEGFFAGLGGESKKMDEKVKGAFDATKQLYETRMTTTEQKVKRR